MPLVSVIIPAYNAQNVLEGSTASILGQSFTDFELIIVNDGSTDSTEQLSRELASRDGRVKVISKANEGVSCARNDGIALASGKYIAFCDADDTFEPDFLTRLVSAVEESGAQGAICGFTRVWPNGGTEQVPSPLPDGLYERDKAVSLLCVPLLNDRLRAGAVEGFIWRCLFLRSVIAQYDIRFSGAYLEDEIFLIEYFTRAQSVVSVSAPMYNYFQNPASVTRRYLPDFDATFSASLERKRAVVQSVPIPVSDGWEANTVWAGLLISVANLFAPGNAASPTEKRRKLREICASEPYCRAIRELNPAGMPRAKSVVAALIRLRAFGLLTRLYIFKNRNR